MTATKVAHRIVIVGGGAGGDVELASPVVVMVARAVGGSRGGGASVTPYGLQLLAEFRAMELRASQAIAAELKAFRRKLSSEA